MKTLESGLIKDQIVYPCKYYELETMCQKIVTEYCHESVGYLGYIVMNPELEKGTFIKGEDSHFYLCDENGVKLSSGFSFGMGDDITLNKYPMSMDSSTFHDCLNDGNCNHFLPKDMVGHMQYFLSRCLRRIFKLSLRFRLFCSKILPFVTVSGR